MSTLHRTRASMSFQNHWNGNPCTYALIGDVFDAVMKRPAVDPASSGDSVT